MPATLDWLSPAEAARLDTMRFTKRRVEYVVARWTAKQAVARAHGLALDTASLRSLEIGRTAEGAPLPLLHGAPLPRRISMTDRAGWAVCVVSPSAVEVGCDLELVEPRSEAFIDHFLTAREHALVRTAPPGPERDRWANLVWSAKESALKVLRTGLRRDTRSVEVHLEPVAADGRWQPLVVRSEEGDEFPGWWRQYGSFLLSTAATVPLPAPAGLDDPPALATAEPVHSWLARPLVEPPH